MVFLTIDKYVINTDNITFYKREGSRETKIFFVGGHNLTIEMEFDEFKNTLECASVENREARESSFSPSGGALLKNLRPVEQKAHQL